MRSEWPQAKIESIAEKIGMGPFGSNIKVSTFVKNGMPIISGQHLHEAKLTDSDYNFITEEHAEKLKNSLVYRGDIVFTHAGNIGQVAYIPANSEYERYILSQRQFYLRCDRSKVLPEFITYYFKTEEGQHKLLANSSQVGVPSIARPVSYLKTIEIPLPSLEEQEHIVRIITSLENKIELNHHINKTLEQIAQAIFKSWFVDFDPAKAKIEAKEKSEDPERSAMCVISGKSKEELEQLSSEQLEQLSQTAALFTDELEESELGMIPKGWGISTIGKEFRVIMGQSPPGQTYNETGDGIIFFQGRRDFGWRYPSNRVYCSAPTRFAKAGDTLLSVRAPVGDINKAKSDCCIGRGLASLRHNSGCEAYTYYSIQRLEKNFKNFDKEGTVFGSINQNDLKTIKIIKPDASILSLFSIIVGNLDKQICLLEDQNSNLSALRDSLLPKLLSGEIQIN